MHVNDKRIKYLLEKYNAQMATSQEVDELFDWVRKSEGDSLLKEHLQELWDNTEAEEGIEFPDWNVMYQSLKPAPVVVMKKRRMWLRWTAVAAVVLFIVGSLWFVVGRKGLEKPSIAVSPKVQQDIAPGREGAILILADGRQIVLDSAGNGIIAQQGSTDIIKADGQVALKQGGDTNAEVLYNTIITPKGRQYSLVLPDGSKVWLNAASSLRFPTVFTGKNRVVELSGEGYFEVAHNAAMPFHVKVNAMDVQVVGTHFNINSYSDEPAVKTTLLEGRVLVKNKGNEVYLNPGQQAVLLPGKDNLIIAYDVNVYEVVAWKNGRFLFNDTDIETIMRQAARWYDVEVGYENKMTGVISGGLPRTENISQFLKILEATGKVKFEINGRQIIVKPNK